MFLDRTRCRASILVQQYRMNMPLATIMCFLFTWVALGYYHSPIHPLPNPVLRNPIRIVDLDTERWWPQVEETLGKEDLDQLWSWVVEAWNCLKVDDVLASDRNMNLE